jgi:hypothetical protein
VVLVALFFFFFLGGGCWCGWVVRRVHERVRSELRVGWDDQSRSAGEERCLNDG